MKKYFVLLSVLGSFVSTFAQIEEPSVLEEIVIPIESAKKFYTIHSSEIVTDSIISRHNGTTTDFFKRFASLHFKENGYGMVSSPSFRGTTAQQTSVLWNGIPVNSNFVGHSDFNAFTIQEYDQIEVIAGGGSVLLGSGAIGGSILMSQKIDFNQKDKHQLSIAYGNLQSYQATLKNRWVKDQWHIGWNIQYTQSENDYKWESIGWQNRNAAFENFTFSPTIAYQINDFQTFSYFGSFYYDERYFALISPFQTPTKYQNLNLRNLIKWKWKKSHQTLEVDAAFLNEKYQYFPNIHDDYYLDGLAKTFYAKSFYQWKWLSFWNNSIQLEYKHSIGNSTENPLKDIEQNIADVSWLHTFSWSNKWKIEAGIKQEWSDVFQNPFLYSLAIEWKYQPWTWSASTSKNYRVPSFNDLFWQPGGNKNLKPETSFQYEAKIRFQKPLLEAQISYYQNYIQDMIRWIPTNLGYWQAENTHEVAIKGIEAQANLHKKWNDWFTSWQIQYAYTDAVNKETNQHLMYVPQHKITSQIDLHYKQWEWGLQAIHVSKVFTTADQNISLSLESFSTLDTQIAKSFGTKKQYFVQAGVYNISNTLYYTTPDRPMPHRNFTIKFTYNF